MGRNRTRVRTRATLVVLKDGRFQIHGADNSIGGLFGKLLLWECEYMPMRKSTSDLIWDFIVLCSERKAVKKLRKI